MEARKSSDPNDWTDGATFFELAAEVESRAPLADSLDHGLNHWTLVAWTGAELLVTMPDADDFVVLLFALSTARSARPTTSIQIMEHVVLLWQRSWSRPTCLIWNRADWRS